MINLCTDFINIADMALTPRDQRHQYLRFKGLGYTDADITDFEERLGMLKDRMYSLAELGGGYSRFKACWDPMLRLCHMLITCSIAGRSQAPKKVTMTDLFYLSGIDVGLVNIPNLLARYLRLFASWRKHRAMISRALGPGRQQVAAVGSPEVTKDAPIVDDGALVILAPVEAPQAPLAAEPARTMALRLARLEEDVLGMRRALGKQREILDSMAYDFSRFNTWMASGLSQMMDQARVRIHPSSFSIRRIPVYGYGVLDLARKEIDKVGEVSIIWNPMCVL
nr:hypothetical protein [Tanacetum cinerariifolium]